MRKKIYKSLIFEMCQLFCNLSYYFNVFRVDFLGRKYP